MLCRHKLLLITWPGFLFLVRFNNCDWTMGFYWSLTLAVHSYALLHKAIMTQFPWNTYAKVFRQFAIQAPTLYLFFPPPTDTLHCNLFLKREFVVGIPHLNCEVLYFSLQSLLLFLFSPLSPSLFLSPPPSHLRCTGSSSFSGCSTRF